jgi:hypothetical protein
LASCGWQRIETHGAGGAIDPGDAIDEETGAQRAEDEVFHAGFERADVAAHVGDEDVEGDGDEFEGDEGSGEILGGGEPHHAGAGENRQRVELAGAVFRSRMIGVTGEDFPVIDGHQHHEDRGDQGEDLVEAGEGIELIEIPQGPFGPTGIRFRVRADGSGVRTKRITPRPMAAAMPTHDLFFDGTKASAISRSRPRVTVRASR